MVHGGSGFDRQRVEIDGQDEGATALVAWLLDRTKPATISQHAENLATSLGLPHAAAQQVVTDLTEAHVLVTAEEVSDLSEGLDH